MTLRIAIEVLNGYTAFDESRRSEWPPSPMRLLSALIASTPDDMGSDDLEWFTAAEPPIIYADSHDRLARLDDQKQCIVARITPDMSDPSPGDGSWTQEYFNRKAKFGEAPIALYPQNPSICYEWPNVELDDTQMNNLHSRLRRLSYLGMAHSLVVAGIVDAPDISPQRRWAPISDFTTPGMGVPLAVPDKRAIELLNDAYDQADVLRGRYINEVCKPKSKEGGAKQRITREAWPIAAVRGRARKVLRYLPPTYPSDYVTLILGLVPGDAGELSNRDAVRIGEAAKGATLRRLDLPRDEVPWQLTGHPGRGVKANGPFELVSWIPLVNEAGAVAGLAVTIPFSLARKLDPGKIGRSLLGVDLRWNNGAATIVAPGLDEPSLMLDRWTAASSGGSRAWRSVRPLVLESPLERPTDNRRQAALRRMISHAGYVVPSIKGLDWRETKPDWAVGESFAMDDLMRAQRPTPPRRHAWIEVEFDEPLSPVAPLAIGGLRHYGLGLLEPVR